MKAQATIEFLFSFAGVLIALSLLATPLILEHRSIEEKISYVEQTNKVEANARALEVRKSVYPLISIDVPSFDADPNVPVPERNKWHLKYAGKIIEVDYIYGR
ncbi:hypothetical protein HY988_05380 [Candidatus Micrarchaeota archaeon]|nr:hypothetical protein [Candidatus Micrarchaeota archaeon]